MSVYYLGEFIVSLLDSVSILDSLFVREKHCARSARKKKTVNPREKHLEGWEDGTPPPHRNFKERKEPVSVVSVVLAVAHPLGVPAASSYQLSLCAQSAPHATLQPHGRCFLTT